MIACNSTGTNYSW